MRKQGFYFVSKMDIFSRFFLMPSLKKARIFAGRISLKASVDFCILSLPIDIYPQIVFVNL